MNVVSQWKKQTIPGLDPGLAESGLCFCFVFHQKLNIPIFSSSLAGKEVELNKELSSPTSSYCLTESFTKSGCQQEQGVFTRIICLVSGWLCIKSVPQHGK